MPKLASEGSSKEVSLYWIERFVKFAYFRTYLIYMHFPLSIPPYTKLFFSSFMGGGAIQWKGREGAKRRAKRAAKAGGAIWWRKRETKARELGVGLGEHVNIFHSEFILAYISTWSIYI